MNPYAVLGVSVNATDQEIKSAYRRLVKRYHPDRRQPEASHEQIAAINEAYDILSDPQKRSQYDRGFAGIFFEPPPPQPEDPVEVYKREFKRKRWEREKQEKEKRLQRRKGNYTFLRLAHMPILVFAIGLALYDLLLTPDGFNEFHLLMCVNSAYICYKNWYTDGIYRLARVNFFLFIIILLTLVL